METAFAPACRVAPKTLRTLQSALPDHPIVLAALADVQSGRINYATLAGLAALADQTHIPGLAEAVLDMFQTITNSHEPVAHFRTLRRTRATV